MTCQQPVRDELTLTISPVSDTANISPCQPLNIPIEAYSSFKKGVVDDVYARGYDDAKSWMKEKCLQGKISMLVFRKRPV